VLGANAIGYPAAPSGVAFSVGVTEVRFVSGIGFLHALGSFRRDARPPP
jgi:hypothetical protein